jgi:hypothetical protein
MLHVHFPERNRRRPTRRYKHAFVVAPRRQRAESPALDLERFPKWPIRFSPYLPRTCIWSSPFDDAGVPSSVATIGYGAPGSRKLPFQQYAWTKGDDWIIRELEQVWDDFTEGEDGIFFSINDLGRMLWLTNPEQYPQEPVCQWLGKNSKRMRLWTYCPIDAEGPNGKLSFPLKHTLLGFKRVLLYSEWSRQIALRSGVDNTEALPHGIDTKVFYPHDHADAKLQFGHRVIDKPWHIKEDEFLIGVVATNQHRKDWHLAIQTAAHLRDHYHKKVRLWLHTDALERFWSFATLLYDYGFIGRSGDSVFITMNDLSDEQMAWGYSACDVTLGIGRGEGFGFPLAESLACGTPVIHGDYGGATDWMPKQFLVDPIAFTHEGLYADAARCSEQVHGQK